MDFNTADTGKFLSITRIHVHSTKAPAIKKHATLTRATQMQGRKSIVFSWPSS